MGGFRYAQLPSFLGYGEDNLSGEPFVAGVSTALSGLLTAVTVWFAVVPVFAYGQYKRAVKEAAVVDVKDVRKVGKDDLRTMRRYYKNAEHITIFSGDFDFVLKDERLRTLLIDLAKSEKLLLVSYKKAEGY